MTKLPKQWQHWCRLARLRGIRRYKGEYKYFYLTGRGRHWRVNDQAMFQCGDTYAEFDRWALCKIRQVPIPQTKEEFLKAINLLLLQQSKEVEEEE